MHKIKFTTIVVTVSFIVVILFVALEYLLFKLTCKPTLIIRLDVGNERSISIYEECGWREISAGIYYDAHEAGKAVIPLRLIEHYQLHYIDQFDFEAVYAEDQSLVGVYDTSGLFGDVIVVDFKTGKAWPPGFGTISYNFNDRINLFKRLKLENPGLFPIATPISTQIAPTATSISKPMPTNTLVIQPIGTSAP